MAPVDSEARGDRTSEPAATRVVENPPIADPAGLGLAAFALTTFLLSAVNAGWVSDSVSWVGYAFAYGGLVQLLAGMWEFRNRNVFGAVAFSTYGGFWLGLAYYDQFLEAGQVAAHGEAQAGTDVGMILLAFAIFNTYMLVGSTQVNRAVFGVFLTLEITEIFLFLAEFSGSDGLTIIGGYAGLITALVAWYTSFAVVINGTAGHAVLPVGGKVWELRSR